ncbi:MAG TPA: FecR domain-containing protein [Kofleriaceae bacterium]|nr:FecR domain-containing protein [Kofleriaceae bacterium]
MKIRVEPPSPEVRRERVEKKLFAQLAAVEMAERVDAVLPQPRRSRVPYMLGAAALAAAVLALVLFARRDAAPTHEVASPSRVVTPVGGESRFIVGDAVIDAKSDTSVAVQHGEDGAITLVLDRGAVDCDVEPRHGRPPFRVLAGDLKVEVVGTRFTVTRTPSLRVDVARGKVKVSTAAGTTLVEAGDSWPVVTAEAQPAPAVEQPVAEAPVAEAPVAEAPIADAPAPAPAPKATAPAVKKPAPVQPDEDLAQKSYRVAQKLETSQPAKAATIYRAIATDSTTTPALAATALLSLAQVELELHDPTAALSAAEEYVKRFPKAASAEEALWVRYQALRALGKRDEARGAAADYLRQFPNGAYADRLQK